MEEPNFFGLSIAYDPYMREVVKAEQFTTCGGDGGRNICGGLGIFPRFLALFAPLQAGSAGGQGTKRRL